MTLWLAKDYINKALNRWNIDGKGWLKDALKEIEGAEAENKRCKPSRPRTRGYGEK